MLYALVVSPIGRRLASLIRSAFMGAAIVGSPKTLFIGMASLSHGGMHGAAIVNPQWYLYGVGNPQHCSGNTLTTLGGDFLAPSLLSTIDSGAGMVACLSVSAHGRVCGHVHGHHVCRHTHVCRHVYAWTCGVTDHMDVCADMCMQTCAWAETFWSLQPRISADICTNTFAGTCAGVSAGTCLR